METQSGLLVHPSFLPVENHQGGMPGALGGKPGSGGDLERGSQDQGQVALLEGPGRPGEILLGQILSEEDNGGLQDGSALGAPSCSLGDREGAQEKNRTNCGSLWPWRTPIFIPRVFLMTEHVRE